MSLNYKEIDAILAELDINRSFIQQIVQPTYDSLALYTYKAGSAKTLYICLAPGACRLHETRLSIPKNKTALRFMEFLRSRIKGGRIESIEQIGQERIVLLRICRSEEYFNMYIRLWSGAANIIVTTSEDEGSIILDSFYRRPKRGEIGGNVFNPIADLQKAADDSNKTEKPIKEWTVRTFDELENAEELSFNEKVAAWYSERSDSLSKEALLEQAEKHYNIRRSKMEASLERLEKKKNEFLHADRLRHVGDLILANAHEFDKAVEEGSHFFECVDFETGSTIRIEINPDKKAHENATSYYEKYKKAISGLEELEKDIHSAKFALLNLEAEYSSLLKEQNPIVIQQKLRKQKTPKQQVEKKYPGLRFTVDGWRLFVGRTASENDELLRKHVKGFDMWLHTRDWAGGYVFIKNRPGKTVPLTVLLDAANLALFYSKGRKAGKADLYYTQVKHLRRAKNAPKGTVLPSNEKNIFVELDDERLRRLEQSKEVE